MALELRQLHYFVTVAEELHFGRAAVRLHMTQPPLSQAIRAFEAELGAPLFERTSRQVSLSAAGQALLPQARHLLQQASALPELVQQAAAGALGILRLAFVSTADYSVLPHYLREFREAYPRVQIELREATSDIQLEELAQGHIDAGLLISPSTERLAAGLAYAPILREPLVLAAPQDLFTSTAGTAVQLQALATQPLIIFPRRIAPFLYDAILTCFTQAGLTPVIGQEAIQMQTIIGLVSAGMGIALVPQSVANLKRPGVVYHPLAGEVPLIETGLAWQRDNPSPVLRGFLELLRKKR